MNYTISGFNSDAVIMLSCCFFPVFLLYIKQAWWKHAENGQSLDDFPVVVPEHISGLEAGFGGRTAAQLARYAYKLQ